MKILKNSERKVFNEKFAKMKT